MKPFRLIVNGGNTHIQEYKKKCCSGRNGLQSYPLSVAGTGVNRL